MSSLSLKHVTKAYPNGFVAVKDFDLEIQNQEFVVFAGPLGCGKSTMLRVIAGLEDATSGEVWLDDRMVNDVEPGDRDIAMLFKNSVLYPDMTVYENMAFGLKLKHLPEAEIRQRVQEGAELLGLSSLLERGVDTLSEGEAMRVALGRVVVRKSRLILMDEPFANLQEELQKEMRNELSRLHRELGLTVVYVALDQAEACALGTRTVLMKDGVVEQADTPQNLYDRPCNVFAAGYIGFPQMNRVDAVAEKDGQGITLTVAGETLHLPEEKGRVLEENGYLGQTVVLGIRPEHLRVAGEAPKSGQKLFGSEVLEREEIAGKTCLRFRMADADWMICTGPESPLQIGDRVSFVMDMDRIHIFDKETRQAVVH